jgi:hypothetical protein
MSQILYYRQHWMATLKERRASDTCGELATYASWKEVDETTYDVNWFCEPKHENERGRDDGSTFELT